MSIHGCLRQALTSLGWNESIEFEQDQNRAGIWGSEVVLTDGEVKFRANNSWDLNWGGYTFPCGRLFSDDQNIPVEKGRYYVGFNLNRLHDLMDLDTIVLLAE